MNAALPKLETKTLVSDPEKRPSHKPASRHSSSDNSGPHNSASQDSVSPDSVSQDSLPHDSSPRNALWRLASGGGVLLGCFLLLAAYGHFSAVWPSIQSDAGLSGSGRFSLLLPGLLLIITGLIDIALCRVLWMGIRWALYPALVFNALAVIYLVFLMLSQSAPDHPIGPFVALVSSYIILLLAIRFGLIWPAVDNG